MKAGNFNIHEYLDRLNEEQDAESLTGLPDKEGLVLPEETKKNYDWLKKEYQKGKVEVKVEMNIGGSKFEPGYELQTDLKSVKDFKPGMYGQVKTSENESELKNPKSKSQPKKESGENESNEEKEPKKETLKVDLKTKKDDKK